LDHEKAQALFYNMVEGPKPTDRCRNTRKDDVCIGKDPSWLVISWQMYDINRITFYIKTKNMKTQHQNNGVRVDVEDGEGNMNTYYSCIDEIWELNYGISLQIIIFKCQWVQHPQGIELDEYVSTLVDLDNIGH
jgi:hypothetical protein